jgi:hypothetical protein
MSRQEPLRRAAASFGKVSLAGNATASKVPGLQRTRRGQDYNHDNAKALSGVRWRAASAVVSDRGRRGAGRVKASRAFLCLPAAYSSFPSLTAIR